MQIKNALIALLGLAVAADAVAVVNRTPFERTLARRQNGGDRSNKGGNNDNNRGNIDKNKNNGGNGGNEGGNNNNKNNNNNNGNAQDGAQLKPDNIQAASNSDGQPDRDAGQSPSKTDANNFINLCSGSENTNGEQKLEGSCNGIPMGQIPSTGNMVSTIIVNPKDGDTIQANQDMTIEVKINNIAAGTFTNPANTYYAAPQGLDGRGNIIGHCHVTVQDTGADTNPTEPLDATQFAFFKGINTPPNGQGLLTAAVDGGLPEGNYRLCTITAAANHQPVLMPVAQRGGQDDCVRFQVRGNNGGKSGGNGDNGGK
ncbi:hypothetical protein NLU13_6645 [Sarocladium strictum]|uniref:Ribosomal protein s17 n=1 Tax=Sarocladium strictum TaxID=5046 RepID=A0AA39L7K8_SARSR|nr:hypothetical protein NLU13_6645 [Sarocladium strictum]